MIEELLKTKRQQITTLPQNLQTILVEGRTKPVLFINHLLGMPLHPGQIKYIEQRQHRNAKINVLVPSNRWGKTTVAACLQIHANFYKLGLPEGNKDAWLKSLYRTANVAPRASLVEPVFNYVDQILSGTFPIRLKDGRLVTNNCQIKWFYLKERTQSAPPMKQYFSNNSYIEHRTLGATAADSLEGKPYGLITYDEGGRSHHLEHEVNGTILARLFDWNGKLDILSTPDQTSPSILYHYELYQKGKEGMERHYTLEGELKDNIFFSEEQIEEQYQLYKGNPLEDQVLRGKFVFGGDNIFNVQDILDAKDPDLNDGKRREDNHTYILSTDTAIGSDEMVHYVIDVTEKPCRVVRTLACKGNSKSPQQHLNDYIDLYDAYKTPNTYPECILETFNGESVRWYHDLPEYIKTRTHCYGSFQPEKRTTDNKNALKKKAKNAKKADILLALQKLLAAKEIKIPEQPELTQQLSIYKLEDAKIPTDRVISLALGAWLALEGQEREEKVTFIDW